MSERNSFYGPGVAALIGSGLIGMSFLIPPTSPDYAKRWLVFLVGLMILAQGAWLLKLKHKDRLSAELDSVLESLLLIVIFGVFAAVFLAGASFFGNELRGGAAFLPSGASNQLGRVLFGLVGGGLALLVLARLVMLFVFILKWISGRL